MCLLLYSWDEWVETDRLMKPTEENLQKVSHDKKQSADVKAGRMSLIKLDVPWDCYLKLSL